MIESIAEMKEVHKRIRGRIERRLSYFRGCASVERIEKEFFFCLLTPQCKARVCWQNVKDLYKANILSSGSAELISDSFVGVRFRNNKARYIVEARDNLFNEKSGFIKNLSEAKDPYALRDYVYSSVNGMGYKESSHFLRNIGRGEDFAILDRHILEGIKGVGLIKKIPPSLTVKRYLEVEKRMSRFAGEVDIPVAHLDFVFWYMRKGEIFK